jgi:hypothetical protein
MNKKYLSSEEASSYIGKSKGFLAGRVRFNRDCPEYERIYKKEVGREVIVFTKESLDKWVSERKPQVWVTKLILEEREECAKIVEELGYLKIAQAIRERT